MLAPLLVHSAIVVVNTVYGLRYLGVHWRISIVKGLGESWRTVLAFAVFVGKGAPLGLVLLSLLAILVLLLELADNFALLL